MITVNRHYKDSLFCALFGSDERKAYALELYNALAGTAYDDPDELEITTISGMVFLGRKNDVSFLVGTEMVLLEHQSTYNPNMPLRGLLYFSKLFNKLASQRALDIYGTKALEIPTPRYFVLYFGEMDRPEREVIKLSDMMPGGSGDIEVTATVLNCNEGRNKAIMEASETLRGYAHLLALARIAHAEGAELEEAVEVAVDQCIEDGALADYLLAHRAEAMEMLFTIEDEERAQRVHWEAVDREAREAGFKAGHEAGYEAGREEGREEGREDMAASLAAMGVDKALIDRALAEAK